MQETGGFERQKNVQDHAAPLEALAPLVPTLDEGVAPASSETEVAAAAPTFTDFYCATVADMVRLAYLLTGSEETARDLVHDCYLRLHAKWSRLDVPAAYLRKAVVNACNSHHRALRRQRDHDARTQPATSVDLEADEMADAIAALPYRQRAAIVLRFWHDCTAAEIADALGCRPGTVGSLIHRALAELRKVLP
jgi:RNA polymerase sigma factor (sigma-70 family)